ncbi:ferredoxin-NADP reductase [Okibacterium sp. HSC-33S16]|uniref:ferredoxin--NADP reductase n=1 Tax=Okibacterium sp. HSC-33S16 TaxID=2910965 RepID=UPI00209F0E6C|nr:oxidoreductase [Okibacterium sp. HSC-33S16]MCP2031747.1 ferredoxin-NADP reductase [Okibacterium sp. HSC-33S16]
MKRAFDTTLGRITMYRQVIVLLVLLAAVSMLLSAFGLLFFTPLELLATLVVAVGVSVSSNVGVARLFRVVPHGESALITGLLLFFIFRPSLELAELGATALAALVATLSKYLIAIRGRHVFNPAAFGAVVVGLTGLGVSWWWVGSQYLLPFVLVTAFLVLYRTRRLAMGGVFVAVSPGVVVVTLASGGMSLGAALATPFTSYPILFLAGFMLSEPLTLPPRRWQQLAEAAIVGVLVAVPYAIGPVYSTPELALIVGNLLAFLVSQRRGIRLELLSRRQVAPSIVEISFRPAAPVRFTPGQYLELQVPHPKPDARGQRRLFSIASAPTSDVVTVAYRSSDSSFKSALTTLEPGARLSATGVWGEFVLPADPARPLLLVAAGIGVTPFLSQLAAEGPRRDVVLVLALADTAELALLDGVNLAGVALHVLAPDRPPSLPPGARYAGPGRLDRNRLAELVPDARSRLAWLSGPPAFVDDLKPALRALGVRRVHTDYFSGY